VAKVPRARRVRDFLVANLERPLLLAFWIFVFWGTLLIAVFGVRVAGAGLSEAAASLWPGREGSALAYANLGAAALAALVWLSVAVLALRARRERP
jgi:hypothetical protein